MLIFQSAEEVLEGAPAMIADGADMAIGTFGFAREPSLAASDRIDIMLRGKSGHAAHPYAAVDPIVGAEDFSAFVERVPAFHLGIGAGASDREDRLHNANYQPDERCIALGVQA